MSDRAIYYVTFTTRPYGSADHSEVLDIDMSEVKEKYDLKRVVSEAWKVTGHPSSDERVDEIKSLTKLRTINTIELQPLIETENEHKQ